jgi:hypothetical protein
MPPRRIPIVEKKLGRDKVLGWAYSNPPMIELDERLRGRLQQEVLIHELLHVALPQLDEETVTEVAEWMSVQTFKFGLRRIQPPLPRSKKAEAEPVTPPQDSTD